jgi:hypothetical protein
MKFNLLHIGKTGGSSLKRILQAKQAEIAATGHEVLPYGHGTNMRMLKSSGGQVIFFIRHPVRRFVSSFNSRLREGKPTYHSPWSAAEASAFGLFKEPDALASALNADDLAMRTAAELAMHSIQHVREPMMWWVGSQKRLERNLGRVLFIGAQETYDADCQALLRKLGVNDDLPELDEKQKHIAPSGLSTTLSGRSQANLEKWYADDIKLYEWCLSIREAINATPPREIMPSKMQKESKGLKHRHRKKRAAEQRNGSASG